MDASLAQRLDRLAAGVIELAGLADGKATRAEHKDLLVDPGQRVRNSRDASGQGLRDAADEVGEQEAGIGRPSARLRVELDREPRPHAVNDALVAPIVGIHHEGHPLVGQRVGVHGEAVILRRDVAASCAQVDARLVHAAVAEFHLVGLRAGRQGEDLVAKADAEDRSGRPALHHRTHVLHGLHALGRVAGPVAEEEAVECVLGEVVVPRHYRDLHAQHIHEVADNVVLNSAINGEDVDGVA
mmetsp:Transcript_26885/g.61268  ORF Transcript_26885/g.61268 Transcript_26885/m.61268 type:complete len:242 (+) Transcript_26885:3467-4192(+)